MKYRMEDVVVRTIGVSEKGPPLQLMVAPIPPRLRSVLRGQSGPLRFADFVDIFMREYVRRYNGAAEVTAKAHMFSRHLLPEFGDYYLGDIGPEKIRRFVDAQVQAGYRPKSINNRLACLHRVLVIAEHWGLVSSVPVCKRVQEIVTGPELAKVPEVSELMALACPADRDLVLRAIVTGTRIRKNLAAHRKGGRKKPDAHLGKAS